jgi:hypothetical protein
MRLALILFALLCAPVIASGQDFYNYLGPGRDVPDKASPVLGIPYNDLGLESVSQKRLDKSTARLASLGAPAGDTRKLLAYPTQDYGVWIEKSYHTALGQFVACGGSIAAKALQFNPASYRVAVQPSAFTDEINFPNEVLAGETIPAARTIKALDFYVSESDGSLSYLPTVLTWEYGNAIAASVGIAGEPRPAGWPCN